MVYFASLIRRMAAGIRAGRSEGVVIMDACVSVGNHWLVSRAENHCESSKVVQEPPSGRQTSLCPFLPQNSSNHS
jgi:hypothetical protein